jgi:hypothetical protein
MLEVRLAVSPSEVAEDALDQLRVHAVVVNRGEEPVDTQLVSSTLLVDGKRNFPWSMSIANGARDAREHALPPGERVVAERVLGPALVSEPGEHEVVLEVGGVRSAPALVIVGQG